MATEYVAPTREELLAELAQEFGDPEIPDNAVTIRMVMKNTGKSIWTCRKYMDRKVAAGEMGYKKLGCTYWYYPLGGE